MATFLAKLTQAGLVLYTAATQTGVPVQLTAMAVGDGGGNPTTPSAAQTTLVREVYRNNLSSLDTDPTDPTLLYAELLIPPNQGGWAIREVGLYTANGVLFAVANFPETYKPVVADGSTRDLVIKFGLKLSNASAITLVIDATIVGATRDWVLSTITPALLFPGGTTGQVLRKKTNADGDTEWADPTASLNIAVDVIKEIQTAVAGQDTFTLSVCTTDGVAVYVDGSREFEFAILSATQVQLARTLPAGIRVLFVQNEPNEPLNLRKLVAGRSYFMGQFV
jgi:phage-related tail fiber protein